jgi:EmrB/QacA subfamily drug resistance transporter
MSFRNEPHGSSVQDPPDSDVAARRILVALMVPSMLMPLTSSMSRVALPVMRGHFGLRADETAWVATAFLLAFTVLMPVYGRLSDGLGPRRLMLVGVGLFTLGTGVTAVAPTVPWIVAGRAIQGAGAGGIMPLGMALISTIFPPSTRGRALGAWSSIGPATAFVGPVLAGVLVTAWGWRAAFGLPLVAGVVAFAVVRSAVPGRSQEAPPGFLKAFDWQGAALLAGAVASTLFFLSSRPVTGVAPMRDWRLLGAAVTLTAALLWHQSRRKEPLISLRAVRERTFGVTSFCAAMRMFAMGGMSFLVPLYLTDVHGLSVARIGLMAMVNPGSMALIVRYGGGLADRLGSRVPVVVGLTVQAGVMVGFSRLPETASLWLTAGLLAAHGLGAGLMLAALHRVAMRNIPDTQMGSAAGLYSMLRFLGVVVGTALAGMLLQTRLDTGLDEAAAYRAVFLVFAFISVAGVAAALGLAEGPERGRA